MRAWIRASPVRLTLFGLCALMLAIVLIPTVISWAPHWLASTHGLKDPSDRAAEIGRVRTALLAVLAGCIAVVGAYYGARTYELNRQSTAQTFELTRQGQITERFTRAVDQLGHDTSVDVRIGGIYGLERLARESDDDFGPIMEILAAYLRVHAPWPRAADDVNSGERNTPTPGSNADAARPEPRPAADAQAVVTVLRRREIRSNIAIVGLDLNHTNLARTRLTGADLTGATLTGANLTRAHLDHADLTGALLDGANLSRADLDHADLTRALLFDATLIRARLREAELIYAILYRADLTGANLTDAELDDAELTRATLTGANLTRADAPACDAL